MLPESTPFYIGGIGLSFLVGCCVGYFKGYREAETEGEEHMDALRQSHQKEKAYMRDTHVAAKATILHAIADDLMVILDKHKIPVRVFLGRGKGPVFSNGGGGGGAGMTTSHAVGFTSRLQELQEKHRAPKSPPSE